MGIWNVSLGFRFSSLLYRPNTLYCDGATRATERMSSYKPAEHEGTRSVAPLLQFFELVHIGDTIQSMMQVFFDKEMVRDCPFN